jgi:hypothetical protein
MKHLLLLYLVLASGIATHRKRRKLHFKSAVYAECVKIESSEHLDVPGIIMADWDVESKDLTIAYKTKKISGEGIHQLVADAGHDTDQIKATDEVYANIHGCCKYRDGASCSGDNQNHEEHDWLRVTLCT